MRNVRLIVVIGLVYIDMLGVGLAYPILPKLVQQFLHGDLAQAAYISGLLASAYSVMQFFFAPVFGALSDRYGRRPLMLASLGGSAASYLIMAFAPGLILLAAARLIAGVMGGSFATVAAYLADITEPKERAQKFGLIGAAFGFGFITGPLIGGVLGGIDLHLPFLAAGLLCLGNLIFGYFALSESLSPQNRTPFVLAKANPFGALREIGRHVSITPLLTVFVLATFANRAYEMIWVLYTSYRFHWGTAQIGLSLGIAGVIVLVGQGWFTGILIPRIGERRAILVGLLVSVVVSVLYGVITQGWMVYCVMPLAVTGWMVAQPAIQGLMSRAVPANEQGLLQGAIASITNLTSIAGPIIWTGLFGYFVGPRTPLIIPGAAFFASALVFAVALILAIRWQMETPAQPVVA